MTTLTWSLLGVAVVVAVAGWLVTGRPRTAAAAAVCALTAATAAIGTASTDAAATDRVGTLVVVTLAGLLAIAGGGPVTVAVFYLVDGHQGGEGAGAIESVRRAGEALRGGAWIGALERAGVFASLVGGWPEGAAIVLGLKGLGRYPELRSGDSPGAAERFIIGTFTSVLWAVACAGLARLLWWQFW